MSSDRTNGYIPDNLYSSGQNVAEIGRGQTASVSLGDADDLNRVNHWLWADVSGDGTHYSHFNGHDVQIDVAFRTENEREVNDWKGRDEIRPRGTYTIALARQQCWEGFIGSDPLLTLTGIPQRVRELLDHPAINWRTATPAAEQLEGRRVYYDRTPAVVTGTYLLDQGCIMLHPVGVDRFPPPVYVLDRLEEDDPSERGSIKVDLLDPKIWWWRDREPEAGA